MTSCGKFKMLDKIKAGFKKVEDTNEEPVEEPEEILPFYLTDLTPKFIEEARTKLNETDEVKEKALSDLRKLIEKEKNLCSPTDDMFLLAFLRARKFRVKDAFKLLKKYWAFRKEYHHIYDTLNSEHVKALILRDFSGFLHFRDRHGSAVGILKVGMWNPEIDPYEEMFRAFTAMLIYSLEFHATQIAGFRIIMDLRKVSWAQLKFCTPNIILLLVKSTQFCFPGRFNGVHVISENKIFKLLWAMAFPLLTNKLKKRVYLHGEDLKPLLEHIHPSVLPEEFGGDAPTFENSKWVNILEEYEPKLVELSKYGYRD